MLVILTTYSCTCHEGRIKGRSRGAKVKQGDLIDFGAGEWEPRVTEAPGLKDEKVALREEVICLRKYVFTRCN